MRHTLTRQTGRGFTLIELLVVIVLIGVILAIGVPNFRSYIVLNRLKAVNSQLITDLQFARSEAMSRGMPVYFGYLNGGGVTCYTLFTAANGTGECRCVDGVAAACPSADPTLKELRTNQLPHSTSVRYVMGSGPVFGTYRLFAFDHVTGGLYYGTTDFATPINTPRYINTIDTSNTTRVLRTSVSPAGVPSVCSAGTTPIAGYQPC